MSHLSREEAQAWLEATKLKISSLDDELEDSISTQVLASIESVYDTSTWVDEITTPALVRKVIAMLYDAAFYRRAYSEEDSSNQGYADWLEMQAAKILGGIIGGTLELPDSGQDVGVTSGPEFWPNDSTGTSDLESAAKFTMSQKF